MITKANIDNWVNYVYEDWHKNRRSVLPSSAKIIVTKMREALAAKNYDEAWNNIERLTHLSGGGTDGAGGGTSQSQVFAEARLECGVGAYLMGDYRQAKEFFEKAHASYTSERHYRAVMHWLIGCVQWLLPSQIDEAILNWENCIKYFDELASSPGSGSAWYRARLADLRRAVDIAVEKNDPPPPPVPVRRPTPTAGCLRSWQVLGEIPAGTPAGTLPTSMDYLEIGTVLIGDVPHRVFSLYSGQNIVNLPNLSNYFILKVRGTSMNALEPVPIQHGDYVLIRGQTFPDKSGDIVASEIYNFDSRATLKRITIAKDKSKYTLHPISHDPEYQSPVYLDGHSFNKVGEGWHIWGVAVALFKQFEEP